MARRRGPESVSIINRRSLGGGWQLRDAIIFPVYFLIPFHLFALLIRHWKLTIPAAAALYLLTRTHSLFVSVFIALFPYLVYLILKFLILYRQHSTIPLTGIVRGFYYIRKFYFNWKEAASNARLGHPHRSGFRPPKIQSVEIANPQGTAIRVRLDLGKTGNTTDELTKAGDKLLTILEAQSSKVTRLAPYSADLLVSWERPNRPTQNRPWHFSPEQHPVPIIDLDETESGVATVDLATSILVGGMSEAGKSNEIWHFLNQLNLQEIPKELWVLDPVGGVELEELEHSPDTQKYVDSPHLAEQLVKDFYDDMKQRLRYMKDNKIRRFVPTKEAPFKILIIDELLILQDMLKRNVNSPLGLIIATGRKAGYVCWACTQLGQKEVISHIRDLFPQRVCLRTKSVELTDCILGSLATQDGAQCHRISRSGEGYVWTDRAKQYVDFYTPLIINTHSIAQGGVQTPSDPIKRQTRTERRVSQGKTFVYQLFDDPTDTYPVYVGIASNPSKRFRQHSDPKSPDFKPWFPSLIHQRSVITLYQTRQEAKERETQLIEFFQPKYNVQERDSNHP